MQCNRSCSTAPAPAPQLPSSPAPPSHLSQSSQGAHVDQEKVQVLPSSRLQVRALSTSVVYAHVSPCENAVFSRDSSRRRRGIFQCCCHRGKSTGASGDVVCHHRHWHHLPILFPDHSSVVCWPDAHSKVRSLPCADKPGSLWAGERIIRRKRPAGDQSAHLGQH